MSAKGNGGLYRYYACSGRQKLGRRGCDGERINRDKLEAAVLGQLADIYRDGTLIQQAITEAATRQDQDREGLAKQRAALAKEIQQAERALDRYHRAFETGKLGIDRFAERVSGLDDRLQALYEQDAQLDQVLAIDAPTAPDTAELATVAKHLDQTVGAGDPKQAKALLRLLISNLQINSRNEILPTYKVVDPSVCAPTSSMEPTGSNRRPPACKGTHGC